MPPTSYYLEHARLSQLKTYKYSAVDKSPVSYYVMQHWWTWTASLMPPWLAPNTITLIGFSAIVLNTLAVWIAVPDLKGPAPSWVYAFCSLGLFFYQTMDNIDGKQARKTGSSSPLGELFDHGIDTLNCPLGGVIQAMAMGLGQSPRSVFCVLVACWAMYTSTWEEYHTGTLYLGYFSGPTEGILIAVAILAASAIKGPHIWETPAIDLFRFQLPGTTPQTQVIDIMMLFVVLSFLFAHLPLCILNVYRSTSSRSLSRQGGGHTPFPRALSQLQPILFLSLLVAAWSLSPHSVLLQTDHLIELAIVVCFVFGQLSTKVVLAHLTKGPYPLSLGLLMPLAVGAVGVNLPYLGLPPLLGGHREIYALHLAVLLSFNSYSQFASRVIRAFCSHLRIDCFSIPVAKEVEMGVQQESRTPRRSARIAAP